eukprot:g5165.t1
MDIGRLRPPSFEDETAMYLGERPSTARSSKSSRHSKASHHKFFAARDEAAKERRKDIVKQFYGEHYSSSDCTSSDSDDSLHMEEHLDEILCEIEGPATSGLAGIQAAYEESCLEEGTVPSTRVMQLLISSNGSSHESLNLNHAQLGVNGSVALCRILHHARVRSLSLAGNSIGDSGARAVASYLANSVLPVEFLDLSDNRINRKGAESLGYTIAVHDSLQQFLIRNNPCGNAFALAFQRSMDKYWCSDDIQKRVCHKLERLDMARTELNSRGINAIAAAMQVQFLQRLKVLNFSWNFLNDEAFCTLVNTMISLPQSAEPGIALEMQELDLCFNTIGGTSATKVSACLDNLLRHASCLRVIDLSHNKFTSTSTSCIPGALRHCRYLRKLSLGFNPLGLQHTLAILKAAGEDAELLELRIENTLDATRYNDELLADTLLQLRRAVPEMIVTVKHPSIRCPLPTDACAATEEREESSVNSVGRRKGDDNEDDDDDDDGGGGDKASSVQDSYQSIFALRCSEAESGTYWDTEKIYQRAFEADWGHTRIERLITSHIELDELQSEVSKRYQFVHELFRYCSAVHSSSPRFRVTLLSWNKLCAFCRVKKIFGTKNGTMQKVFFQAAASLTGGSQHGIMEDKKRFLKHESLRNGKDGFGSSSEDEDDFYAASGAATHNSNNDGDDYKDDDHLVLASASEGLARHQFLEGLVRLALVIVSIPKLRPAEIFKKMMEKTFEEYAFSADRVGHIPGGRFFCDANFFREERLYMNEVNMVLLQHEEELRRIYRAFAVGDGEFSFEGDYLLSLREWLTFCTSSGLISLRGYSEATARLAFSYSQMVVADPLRSTSLHDQMHRSADMEAIHAQLSFIGFLEAVARIADMSTSEEYAVHAQLSTKLRSLLKKVITNNYVAVQQEYLDADHAHLGDALKKQEEFRRQEEISLGRLNPPPDRYAFEGKMKKK